MFVFFIADIFLEAIGKKNASSASRPSTPYHPSRDHTILSHITMQCRAEGSASGGGGGAHYDGSYMTVALGLKNLLKKKRHKAKLKARAACW